MELSNALLVAMMFVVLLTMAIGSIVTALAVTVDRRSHLKFDKLHTSWMLLLLLVCFNLFWHVLDILSIEEWVFLEFLYIVGGAVIVLFASHVLVPDAASGSSSDMRRYYYEVAPQFFVFVALLQAWVFGVDLMFGGGFTAGSALNAVVGLIALALATTKSPGNHQAGTAAAWLVFVASLVLQSLKTAS
jgi:hypothetical protein